MRVLRFMAAIGLAVAFGLGTGRDIGILDDDDAPQLGTIVGVITPAKNLKRLNIIERGLDITQKVNFDPRTGKFRAGGLLPGSYDLVMETAWGTIEGIGMAFRAGEFDDLVPPEFRDDSSAGKDVPPKPTPDDLKAIRKHIHKVKRYENKVRDIHIIGNGARVTVLVELLRDADFYGRKGDEITWRLERWYYEKKFGAWERVATNVLFRKRLSMKVFRTWTRQFEPAVGGLEIKRNQTEARVVIYRIPKHPTRKKGLVSASYKKVDDAKPKKKPGKKRESQD
ncbi:MAG: hypothetical protein QF662_03980 [Phycisphaerae bacterium]|nr:hypothetical protein [Phycisphaerae bacterium]